MRDMSQYRNARTRRAAMVLESTVMRYYRWRRDPQAPRPCQYGQAEVLYELTK